MVFFFLNSLLIKIILHQKQQEGHCHLIALAHWAEIEMVLNFAGRRGIIILLWPRTIWKRKHHARCKPAASNAKNTSMKRRTYQKVGISSDI